jgi:RNA polymerase sigma factor (sigma-70 family)
MELQSFDSAYIQRLVDGDLQTMEHFATYFGERLSRMLILRLRDPALVEDVRQETFLHVLRYLRTHTDLSEHPERLPGFVHAVAVNVSFEMMRANKRAAASIPQEMIELQPGDPEHEFISFENKAIARRLLEGLTETDRELLTMVFLDEMDKDEVCRKLNVDRGYLRVLLHRARARLRESYKKSLAG